MVKQPVLFISKYLRNENVQYRIYICNFTDCRTDILSRFSRIKSIEGHLKKWPFLVRNFCNTFLFIWKFFSGTFIEKEILFLRNLKSLYDPEITKKFPFANYAKQLKAFLNPLLITIFLISLELVSIN